MIFNFNNLGDFDDLVNILYNFDDFRNFSSFNNDLSHNFRDSNDLFLNNWNFNSSVDDFFDLLNHWNWVVHNFLNLLYSILIDNFLLDNFHFFDCGSFNLNLNDFLNDLWNFNNFFDCLDHRNWFLNNNLNNFRNTYNLVHCLPCILILDDFYWFFNDSVERFDDLNNFFNNFLFHNWNLNHFSYDSLNRNNFFLNYLNFSDFRDSVVDYLLNNSWFFDFNNLFFNNSDFDQLRNLNNSFNNFLYHFGNFNYLFSVLR